MISAHTFAYISLDAMIPQEADQTQIEYGFPVVCVTKDTPTHIGHKIKAFISIKILYIPTKRERERESTRPDEISA